MRILDKRRLTDFSKLLRPQHNVDIFNTRQLIAKLGDDFRAGRRERHPFFSSFSFPHFRSNCRCQVALVGGLT